ncbi:hypothetical protein BUALT_Bualt12G0116100 [Buddleja alternifolia]|uniref:Uncharacterized protein n=1 Tax=Buddleja alternifolia TaxID=168488 RepID=A0AAV6WS37_9LAMI|nr:hypothetical protein BUALT_Bualt12G0116100 [Buddleja alternifolia]
MAVTHADLAPSTKNSDLGSKTGAFLMVLSILLGLFCFILCLIAEATRSEVTWDKGKGIESQCKYSGSGKLPLLSSSGAFLALAMAMIVQHAYILIAVSKSDSLAEIGWDADSAFAKTLSWQAGFFFVATWVSFAVGEILLLIGLSVESGHLKNWSTPRPSCLIIPQGLFTSAGVSGLATVFLASGLYITVLRAETYFQERENTRREILEASVMYASPLTSPAERFNMRTVPNENPSSPRQDQNFHTLYHYLRAFDKNSSLV